MNNQLKSKLEKLQLQSLSKHFAEINLSSDSSSEEESKTKQWKVVILSGKKSKKSKDKKDGKSPIWKSLDKVKSRSKSRHQRAISE